MLRVKQILIHKSLCNSFQVINFMFCTATSSPPFENINHCATYKKTTLNKTCRSKTIEALFSQNSQLHIILREIPGIKPNLLPLCFHHNIIIFGITYLHAVHHTHPTFLWERATPVIVGWFAGHMCKNNNRWYT